LLFTAAASAAACAALSAGAPVTSHAYEQAQVVRYGGKAKPALNVDKNRDICGSSKPDDAISVSGGMLKNVVISIEGIARGPRKPLPKTATIDQKGCLFQPRVQAVATGGTYELLNGDPIFHNVRIWQGSRSQHNVAMPLKGMRVKKAVGGTPGVVKVSCDAHSWMRAWVVVKDHPYVTVSDSQGRFTLEGVPPGTYTVEAWHEALGTKKTQVTVPARGEGKVSLSF
jgi:plastocyanin